MLYHWRKIAGPLYTRGVDRGLVDDDLRRIADSCYGPITAPLSPQPVCLLAGERSGLEAAFIKAHYPGATIFILGHGEHEEPDEYTYVRNIRELKDLLSTAPSGVIDFCRIDEVYFTDALVTELLAAGLKINYLCGIFLSTVRTPYQLHRDLSAISGTFYIRRSWGADILSKSEPEIRKYVSVVVPA